MSMKHLKLLYNIGKIFAITPLTSNTGNLWEKLHGLLLLAILAMASAYAFYNRSSQHENFTQIKLAVNFSIDASNWMFTLYSVLAPAFLTKSAWLALWKNLDASDYKFRKTTNISYLIEFFVVQAIFGIINIYWSHVWFQILGGNNFWKQDVTLIIHYYYQYFYTFLMIEVTRLILIRYKFLKSQIEERLLHNTTTEYLVRIPPISYDNFYFFIKKLEKNYCLLRQTVDLFNQIFGWPILLSIFCASLLLLNYLSDLLKNDFGFVTDKLDQLIVANVLQLMISMVGTIILIMLCDAVMEEARKIIMLACKLQSYFPIVDSKERQQLADFITLAKHNMPEFTAAGYFDIDRSTILSMLSITMTYLIVTIQFGDNIIVQ